MSRMNSTASLTLVVPMLCFAFVACSDDTSSNQQSDESDAQATNGGTTGMTTGGMNNAGGMNSAGGRAGSEAHDASVGVDASQVTFDASGVVPDAGDPVVDGTAPDAGDTRDASDRVDAGVERPEAHGCTLETATDRTADSIVNLAWSNPHDECLAISTGTTVVWTGNFTMHPLLGGISPVADGSSVISTSNQSGASASVTFDDAGDYPYFCETHIASMTGVLYVE